MNSRVYDAPRQIEALGRYKPDVVALQDVRYNAIAPYKRALADIGLRNVLHTLEDISDGAFPTGVLVASCFELSRLPSLLPTTLWPEGYQSPDYGKVMKHWSRRTLFVTMLSPCGRIDLYNAYITPANHKEITEAGYSYYPWIKLDLFTGIYNTLAVKADHPRILCGDFNSPQEEKPTGEIITWGYDMRREGYRLTRPDQDKAERAVLQGLAAYDLTDVYRRVYGYENCGSQEACSWRKYRFDHVFASKAVCVQSIHYLQSFREERLSDHVPLEAVFDFSQSG